MQFSGFEVPGLETISTLGTGPNSVIYKVRESGGKEYALKAVTSSDGDNRFIVRATNEYEIGCKLEHPVIRKCYKIFRLGKLMRLDAVAILMELVEGPALEEQRPRELGRCIDICQQVAQGIQAMHDAGYVHADLKPANILLPAEGTVKVIDFGQSCLIGEQKGAIQGTPAFIAPEQLRSSSRITIETDVYNFGATLYWLCTGQHIHGAAQMTQEGLQFGRQSACLPPAEINAEVPSSLSRMIMACLRPKQDDRPHSMKGLMETLALARSQLIRGKSMANTPLPPPGETGVFAAVVEEPAAEEAAIGPAGKPLPSPVIPRRQSQMLRVLLLDPNVQDAQHLESVLARVTSLHFTLTRVETLAAAMEQLESGTFELVLCETALSDAQGMEVVNKLHNHERHPAVVVLAKHPDETLRMTLKAIGSGAQDYVAKDDINPTVLPRILMRALQRHRVQQILLNKSAEHVRFAKALKSRVRKLEDSEARYRSMIEDNGDGIFIVDREQIVRYANPAAENLLAPPTESMVGQSFRHPLAPGAQTIKISQPNGRSVLLQLRIVPTRWEDTAALLVTVRAQAPLLAPQAAP